jgi:hypothetical protein
MIVDRRFRGAYSSLMMEAVRISETSVDNHFTRQYIPEDNSDHHTRRRENLKSHIVSQLFVVITCVYVMRCGRDLKEIREEGGKDTKAI